MRPMTPNLDRVHYPADLRGLSDATLVEVARELRAEVISAVSETGGHLGSSLGVVELTVALHTVFDTPRDKLIWDVGHQCYPHKVLTGRRDRIRTLRQEGGLSGFTKRSESAFDPFGAAHSSTSISAALGFTVGRDMGLPTGDAIAVIGDGSISAGMAYEALNNAGHEKRRMFVILNDNEMSIAPPTGAMSKYLSSLYEGPLGAAHRMAEGFEAALPGPIRDHARRARQLVTGLPGGQGTLFEELGLSYIGPIDGHDLTQLLPVLRAARARATGPVLIHVCTVKGKGYAPAELAADRGHGVSKFEVATGAQAKSRPNAPAYTKVFGQTLTRLAEADPRIVAVSAAMPSGTGVNLMADRFPTRVFDVGDRRTARRDLPPEWPPPACAPSSARSMSTSWQRADMTRLAPSGRRCRNLHVRFAITSAGSSEPTRPTMRGPSIVAGFLVGLPTGGHGRGRRRRSWCTWSTNRRAHDSAPSPSANPGAQGEGGRSRRTGRRCWRWQRAHRLQGRRGVPRFLSFGAQSGRNAARRRAAGAAGAAPHIADARFAKPRTA